MEFRHCGSWRRRAPNPTGIDRGARSLSPKKGAPCGRPFIVISYSVLDSRGRLGSVTITTLAVAAVAAVASIAALAATGAAFALAAVVAAGPIIAPFGSGAGHGAAIVVIALVVVVFALVIVIADIGRVGRVCPIVVADIGAVIARIIIRIGIVVVVRVLGRRIVASGNIVGRIGLTAADAGLGRQRQGRQRHSQRKQAGLA